jgi:ParB family chromosome partitioning protein
MRVCGEMALDQIALFQTAKGLKSQSHSCFQGRMAVTAVILPFFVPAAFNRRNTNMEEPKSKAKRGAKTAAAAQEDKITLLPLSELHDFPNHPFKVRDDEAMQETAESIRQYGVLVPAIVRPREDGGYEIIAGHRRRHGSELAGLSAMPCIVRQMDDDTATILMVDSNIQRENILPSERAQAYKMKLEAIRRKAGRPAKGAENLPEENCDQVGHNFDGKRSVEIIADEAGESKSQVQRYIRLTELTPELQQMVDEKKIGMTPAVEISYLKPEEQQMLLTAIDSEQATPSLSQAQRMKKLSREGKLNDDTMLDIMMEQKKPEGYNVVLSADKLRKYFPRSYTPQKMEETILKLLDAWLRKRQRDQSR